MGIQTPLAPNTFDPTFTVLPLTTEYIPTQTLTYTLGRWTTWNDTPRQLAMIEAAATQSATAQYTHLIHRHPPESSSVQIQRQTAATDKYRDAQLTLRTATWVSGSDQAVFTETPLELPTTTNSGSSITIELPPRSLSVLSRIQASD